MTGWLLFAVGAWLLVAGRARYRVGDASLRLHLPRWRRRHDRRDEAVVELLAGLRDELASGSALRPAFLRAAAATGAPVAPQSQAVCRMGGDVPEMLRAEAGRDQLLVALAALWQVCEESGGAMAAALDRLVDGARETARLRAQIASELAGPRSTVRVLAFLPLVGLAMGFLLGINPLQFLLTTPWGWGCILGAVLLEVAGIVWVRKLVRGIEQHL